MRRPKLLAFLILGLVAVSHARTPRCGPSWFAEHGVRKPETITLTGPMREPGDPPVFYLKFERKQWFLVYLRPEDLVKLLESYGVSRGGTPTTPNAIVLQSLYDAVTADLPLKQDTDLFGYSLRNIQIDGWLEGLIDALMLQGKVGIDLWIYRDRNPNAEQDAQDPKTITKVSIFDGDSERNHIFCTPDGRQLFDHWNYIE